MSRFLRKTYLLSAAAVFALVAMDTIALAQGADEEIIVTARRRSENVQKTPVTVNAFTPETLKEAGIKNFTDLTAHVPGTNFVGSGGFLNTVFSIRGVSRSVVGNVQPAVGTYVNEVPLPYWGANIPTYDVSSIQVLKGPQGTLFGRNTTAGAILVQTNAPTYDFGGTLEGTFGDYAWKQLTGAVNIPIVKDKVALRIAGQWARRDGTTKNFNFPDHDLDDIHRDQARISLLVEPFEGFKNVTVYDWLQANQNGGGVVPVVATPGNQLAALGGGIPFGVVVNPATGVPTGQPNPFAGYNVAGFLAAAQANPRTAFSNYDLFEKAQTTLLTNVTTWDIGDVTLKNVFGYRTVSSKQLSNVDGAPFPAVDAFTVINHEQWSEEFQVSGKALNDKLDWVAGVFLLDFRPNGGQIISIQQFNGQGVGLTGAGANQFSVISLGPGVFLAPGRGANGTSEFFYDKTAAAFGQIGYDLGGISEALDGLKVDLGYRYTKDTEKACAIPGQYLSFPLATPEQCNSQALIPNATGPTQGTIASSKSYASTYTIGLNYQATDDIFLYAVHRRGYRAGGLNTPVFGGTLVPFQSYKPETVQDVEVGFKTNWRYNSWSGRFNVAAYTAWYQRLIAGLTTGNANNPDGEPGAGNPNNNPSNTTFFANVGKARVSGIEIEGSISPIEDLEINYAATWIDKNVTDSQITLPSSLPSAGALSTTEGIGHTAFLGAPKYTYSAGIRYVLPLADTVGEVVFNASHFITSSMAFAGLKTKPWNKTDFRIDWNGIYGSPIDAGLFVTNAFDTTGVIYGSLTSEGLGYASGGLTEPRIFGGTIRYHFGAE